MTACSAVANGACIKKFPEAFIIKDGTAGFANHNKPGEGAVDV